VHAHLAVSGRAEQSFIPMSVMQHACMIMSCYLNIRAQSEYKLACAIKVAFNAFDVSAPVGYIGPTPPVGLYHLYIALFVSPFTYSCVCRQLIERNSQYDCIFVSEIILN